MENDHTPLTGILREEILRDGPISFERFMEQALYHPEYGYYCRNAEVFGKAGDFYTAAQLQPVYGNLIRRILESLTADRAMIDLGAGRGDMAGAFAGWSYQAIDAGDRSPVEFRGVVFANELFDALPCRVFGDAGEVLVGWKNNDFAWTSVPRYEECPRAHRTLAEIARFQRSGLLLIVDYGYDERERVRFPNGTLMSYRKHAASDEVLRDPGTRDITAHVNFSFLERSAEALGFRQVRKRTSLASLLLSAGEKAIEAAAEASPLQIKTLLFGMGEVFQALVLEKAEN